MLVLFSVFCASAHEGLSQMCSRSLYIVDGWSKHFSHLSFPGATAHRGPGPPHSGSFWITHNDIPRSVGLLCRRDRPVPEICTWQHNTHKRQTSMPPAGFESAVTESDRRPTLALDCSATGIATLTSYSHETWLLHSVVVSTFLRSHPEVMYRQWAGFAANTGMSVL